MAEVDRSGMRYTVIEDTSCSQLQAFVTGWNSFRRISRFLCLSYRVTVLQVMCKWPLSRTRFYKVPTTKLSTPFGYPEKYHWGERNRNYHLDTMLCLGNNKNYDKYTAERRANALRKLCIIKTRIIPFRRVPFPFRDSSWSRERSLIWFKYSVAKVFNFLRSNII